MAFFVYWSQYRTYLKPGYIFRLKEMAGSEGDNSLVTSFTNLPIACGKVKQTTFKQEKKKNQSMELFKEYNSSSLRILKNFERKLSERWHNGK